MELNDLFTPQDSLVGSSEQAEPIGGIPIQSVRPRHNAIMDFILANPTVQMQHVAIHFKVTRSWLSIIVNSDCFQGMMREKQEKMFDEMLVPLSDKITGVAHLAIERLGKQIEESTDASFILDSSDKLLKTLGYGAKSAGVVQVQVHGGAQVAVVNSDVLAEARARMLSRTPTISTESTEPEPDATTAITVDAEAATGDNADNLWVDL